MATCVEAYSAREKSSGPAGWLDSARRRSQPFAVLVALALLIPTAGCGSAAPAATERPATAANPADSIPLRLRSDSVYSVSDVEGAGWKKSKQLSHELLPLAEDVWYGFFEQKDIEVRVYASHSDASGAGEVSAAQSIGRTQSPNVGGGALISGDNRVQYHAYVVAGNLVLLCERAVDDCLRLVNRLR